MNHNRLIDPTLLDELTLSAAVDVGDLCFPSEEDCKYFREVFALIAKGVMLRHSPGLNRMVRILPHFLYRTDGVDSGIGGLCEYENEESVAYLGWFGVVPQMRRRGVASAIIGHLATLAELYGYTALGAVTENDSSNKALEFYRNVGFVDGPPVNFNGVPCLAMRLRLKAVDGSEA